MSVNGGGRKLLLIDEDPVLLRGYGQRLIAERWDVTTAEDAYEAMTAIQNGPWDLVLLGLRIPFRSAVEVVRALRQRKDTATTPIWVLAQPGDADAVDRAMREGADGVLEKAKLGPRDIVEEVERIVEGRRRAAAARVRVVESAVPAAVDEIARRLRNPEAAARASFVSQPGQSADAMFAPTGAAASVPLGGAPSRAGARSLAGGGAGGASVGGGTIAGGGAAGGATLGGAPARAASVIPSTPPTSVSMRAPESPSESAAAAGWSAGPRVRLGSSAPGIRTGPASLAGLPGPGVPQTAPTRLPRAPEGSQTGCSSTTGDITGAFRVGAPGSRGRPVIPAGAAISASPSPAAAAASAAFDAAMAQSPATFDTTLNRMVGQAAALAGALGLPADFTCPVCASQLVLRLSPEPRVENGVSGHFYCGRCTGPR